MIIKHFSSILELLNTFNTEDKCIKHLESIRWRDEIWSPFDRASKIYICKLGKYKCRNTGKYFNVKTGTVFHGTKISLQKWFVAIWLFNTGKKGITSIELAAQINITQSRAWVMLTKLRKMTAQNHKLSGIVEIDETFMGGKNKNRHRDKKMKYPIGRVWSDKIPVLGMLQRDGLLTCVIPDSTSKRDLLPHIYNTVVPGSIIFSDEWYCSNDFKGYSHHSVNHSAGIYGRGLIHNNSIEGYWSILKRSIFGVYHSVSKRHLQGYLDECSFKFNYRHEPTAERFNRLLTNMN